MQLFSTALDQLLCNARFKSLVHGDAKLANFCFANDGQQVAAVDFQYVGGGCGIKDVAYFIGSAFAASQCEQFETELLDIYFTELLSSCTLGAADAAALEREWRELYAVAWTDFHRFLLGWMPAHPKVNSYSERLCRETLARLSSSVRNTH